MTNIIYTNEENFKKDVLDSEKPVILDFYSDECPPCDQLAPMFELMAEKYGHLMKFVKIFRQENWEIAEKYNVTSSPTVIFIDKGERVGKTLNGYIKKSELRMAIEEVIGEEASNMELKKVETDVLIFGAGIAGLSAAIYAKRAKLDTVIIEESVPGGQIATTEHIANYPGTNVSISGKELANNVKKQAEHYKAKIDYLKEIFEVDLSSKVKYCRTEDTEYFAKTAIIAVGSQPRDLQAINADKYKGKGVHYCATCDGFMYQDRRVIVVGGGDSALKEAIYLTRFAEQVTIVYRSDKFRASNILQEEAKRNPKIDFIMNSEITEIKGETYYITQAIIKDNNTNETKEVDIDGIFVYIGMQPKTEYFQNQLKLNDEGYIEAGEDTITNIDGVFVAGDVRTKLLRQAITAASDGAIAAVMAEKYVTGFVSGL